MIKAAIKDKIGIFCKDLFYCSLCVIPYLLLSFFVARFSFKSYSILAPSCVCCLEFCCGFEFFVLLYVLLVILFNSISKKAQVLAILVSQC